MKQCTKCKTWQNETEFYKQDKGKNGLCSQCKTCQKQKATKYKQTHKEQVKQYDKQYRKTHKEQKRKHMDLYNVEHRERINKNGRKRYQKYREQELQRSSGKTARRKRNLGFELLFDNIFDCPVDYHHVSDAFVIAIPRNIHRANLGQRHRQQLKPIIEELYNISYIIMEE